jgi:hypothetical protein
MAVLIVDGGNASSVFSGTLDGGTASTVFPPSGPDVTVYLDANPAPRVEVLLEEFAAGTKTVTVYRLAEGREYQVRGAVQAPTAGALTRIDNEVPFGIPVTYRAEMFDGDGLSLGFTGSTTTQVDAPDMWVHNPLDPRGAVQIDFTGEAAPDLTRVSEGDIYYPQGRRVGVLVSGQRRGLSEVVLDIIADDVETADRFSSMLGGYGATTVPALCFRTGADHRVRLPRPFFASVLSCTERDVDYAWGGSRIAFTFKGDEIAPPAVGVTVPLLTNADLNAHYSSNSAIDSDNLNNLAVNRRYELAGTAG